MSVETVEVAECGSVLHAIMAERGDSFCRYCGKELGEFAALVWHQEPGKRGWYGDYEWARISLGKLDVRGDERFGYTLYLVQGSGEFSSTVRLATRPAQEAVKELGADLVRLLARGVS
jgi:hypothetical protein